MELFTIKKQPKLLYFIMTLSGEAYNLGSSHRGGTPLLGNTLLSAFLKSAEADKQKRQNRVILPS